MNVERAWLLGMLPDRVSEAPTGMKKFAQKPLLPRTFGQTAAQRIEKIQANPKLWAVSCR
jgi:hypothetical protein